MRLPFPQEKLDRALELQSQFWTQDQIAKELGVARETVSRALSRHNRRALKRLESRTAAVKAKQIAQLEWVAGEAIQGWHRSKQDAETIKTTDGLDVNGRPVNRTETTVKGQSGNPSHLSVAMNALTDVRKILALEPKDARGVDDHPAKQIEIPEEDDDA